MASHFFFADFAGKNFGRIRLRTLLMLLSAIEMAVGARLSPLEALRHD
jgi:hypothetical protein